MVTYNPFTNLYKVFGKTLTEKRAKRDGRNPATGAFQANTTNGRVDLTMDVAMVKGTINVSLPDKTGIRKKPLNADFISNNFKDRVKIITHLDLSTIENSTFDLTDEYGNTVNIPQISDDADRVYFNGDGFGFALSKENEKIRLFGMEDEPIIFTNIRRTVSGSVLCSGYHATTSAGVEDFEINVGFPVFIP